MCHRFGRKRGVIVPMLLAAVGAAGSVLLTTDDESNKGNNTMKIKTFISRKIHTILNIFKLVQMKCELSTPYHMGCAALSLLNYTLS